jgi:hypothetical protein
MQSHGYKCLSGRRDLMTEGKTDITLRGSNGH